MAALTGYLEQTARLGWSYLCARCGAEGWQVRKPARCPRCKAKREWWLPPLPVGWQPGRPRTPKA